MLKIQCRNSSKMSNKFQNILQCAGHFCVSYQNSSLIVITDDYDNIDDYN